MNTPQDLVCVVPVYNEADVLPQAIPLLVTSLREQLPDLDFRVIIANNGSTDETAAVAERLVREYAPFVQQVVIAAKGRGRALREVIGKLPARRYLYIDVDLPCELSDLPAILAPLDDGADLVVNRRVGRRPLSRRFMTMSLRMINRLLFGVRLTDSQCAIKALSPAAAQVLAQDCRQDGWYLDTELVVLAHRRGLSTTEVPVHWVEQRFPGRRSKVQRWSDSWAALRALRQIWWRRLKLR